MTDSEKQVCNYLRELDLWWVFESPIFVIDEKECGMVWTPDFNVPKLDMYIEVCGTDEFDYEYQKKIYYKNGYRVAFIKVYKEKWKNFLVDMIMDIEEKRHVEVMKIRARTPERDKHISESREISSRSIPTKFVHIIMSTHEH
ncbi:hypothetical protein A3K78_05805 [Candidatus Bathyarchaeota archaeon RBG_13_52_12]|nr:MAG: hypothetical protein A3K78_05805 [Candidatus Bathyarchaeota archaeon RBG_13_52_12]